MSLSNRSGCKHQCHHYECDRPRLLARATIIHMSLHYAGLLNTRRYNIKDDSVAELGVSSSQSVEVISHFGDHGALQWGSGHDTALRVRGNSG